MVDWKRVKISFKTVKLSDHIEEVKTRVSDITDNHYNNVYGVTNVEGITKTNKAVSQDISNYKIIDKYYFAYNPYRINVGSIGFVDSDSIKGSVSPAYVVFKTKPSLNPFFLFRFLKSDFGNHLINWYGNKGGVRNSLTYKDLCKIDIPDISIADQQKIINKLNDIYKKNNLINKNNEYQFLLLNKLKKAILQEAIEGKLTADWRKKHPELISGKNRADNLLKKIKKEKYRLIKEKKRPKPIQNPITKRELHLPNEWTYCKADEILFVTKLAGFEYTKYIHLKDKGDIAVVRAQNVKPMVIDKTNLLYIDDTISIKLNRSALTKPCLLVTFIGAGIGDVAIFNESKRWHLAPNVAKMELLLDNPNSFKINLKYLNYYLLSNTGRKQIFKHIKATAQPSLSMGTIRDIDFIIPPLFEQNEIVNRIDYLMGFVGKIEEKISFQKQHSDELIQSLLREAFEDQ